MVNIENSNTLSWAVARRAFLLIETCWQWNCRLRNLFDQGNTVVSDGMDVLSFIANPISGSYPDGSLKIKRNEYSANHFYLLYLFSVRNNISLFSTSCADGSFASLLLVTKDWEEKKGFLFEPNSFNVQCWYLIGYWHLYYPKETLLFCFLP